MTLPPLDAPDLAPWGLTGVVVGTARSTFPGRAVYPVQSDQGVFAAKVSRRTSQPNPGSEDSIRLLEYLQARGLLHVPTPLRTLDGHASAASGGSDITVLEFVPRPLYAEATPPASAWSDLGAAAAALNDITGYPRRFAVPVDEALVHLRARSEQAAFERPFRDALARASQVTESSRAALIHGEINEANALRRHDGTVVLVDWDQAGTGPVALELGYPLIIAFVDIDTHRLHEQRAKAFYDAYRSSGGIVDPLATFAAAVFHALRYMWFADVDRRWDRISWALRNESQLLDVVAG
ncbi:MAG: Phosphotransferase enzyme family [Acidimicrobiaceae bacterium]|nr:Phosphotransferase enzyme family [Acidimicrobiaceae bacterium]